MESLSASNLRRIREAMEFCSRDETFDWEVRDLKLLAKIHRILDKRKF